MASSSRPTRPPMRLLSSGSFHAGAPIPSPWRRGLAGGPMRRQSTYPYPYQYHTFPTPTPPLPSTPSETTQHNNNDGEGDSDGESDGDDGQLGLLALLSLAEQTALNSISPYVPAMVASYPEVPDGEEGLYVGILASAFALAQLATNLLWGYTADKIGRKPVLLLGALCLMLCFAVFGFCTTFAQLIVVHVAMGLFNGNAAVVPTCLGEITNRSNQSRAFIWLPLMYSIGGITGPAVGGLLVRTAERSQYPFLAPNILSAALLLSAAVVLAVYFDETLEGLDDESWQWLRKALACCGLFRNGKPTRSRSWSARWSIRASRSTVHEDSEGNGSGSDDDADADDGHDSRGLRQGLLGPRDGTNSAPTENAGDTKLESDQSSAFRQLANRTTVTLLGTYLVFQLSNISFNSLFPIFASAPGPTGRELGPSTIGLGLSVAGFATILFQIFAFHPIMTRMGNLGTYRLAILGIAASTALMPLIGHLDDAPLFGIGSGKIWLYLELGTILVFKNASAVGGLSSVMLLITNSAPSHETLGTLNGIAQTLSAAGRSVGPLLSGGLFTLSTRLPGLGDLFAWGVFAGIALVGWFGTLSIRRDGLESADWDGGPEEGNEDGEGADVEAAAGAR
ncbi:hypothetical protein P8C59_009113 [Phyllachora maydis]|uniref:Major facilitator superfamily (MFS) profile domain-containing protein n=1 Tax=Phyllachora maydis TaxID=1825666 RepID=A0AAD9MJB1_9PEZI|nr:hypothetical protein P8C59_009113 [Phyllachora maydis]